MTELVTGPKLNLPEVKAVKQADPEDEVVKEAARKKRDEEMARNGRASTNLTGGPPPTYSNTQLGS